MPPLIGVSMDATAKMVEGEEKNGLFWKPQTGFIFLFLFGFNLHIFLITLLSHSCLKIGEESRNDPLLHYDNFGQFQLPGTVLIEKSALFPFHPTSHEHQFYGLTSDFTRLILKIKYVF